jgi:uncharacterized membrane protein
METTAHLWAIGYDDMERADQVCEKIVNLGWDRLDLFLEGIAVVVRHPNGTFTIHQGLSPGVAFFLGLSLVGFLAGLATGMPLAGAALGAFWAGGAAVRADRVRIEAEFICDVQGLMRPGTSALFVLDEEGDMDAILPAIRGLGGTILKTNVNLERERD